jgi:DNA-binding transcriptional LysR family regulator
MPLLRISLRQYEAFVAVADLGGFAAAAHRLGLSASAISQLVAELESTIGFRVFDRSTRKVSLSRAGRDFLASAETVLRHLRLAESAADDVRNRAAGFVRVGAPLVLASAVLPAAVHAFTAQRPKVVVRLRDTAVDALVQSVASGDVDLSVGPDRVTDDVVRRDAVFESPWVLWCSPRHRLATRRTVQWADLRDEAIVAAGRDHERSVAQMHVNLPEGERVRPVDVVDNITTALGLAAEGLAVTLAPAYVEVLASKFKLVMRRVMQPETIRQVCIYQPTARAIPPAAESFAEFLVHWLRRWHRGTRQQRADAMRRTRARATAIGRP